LGCISLLCRDEKFILSAAEGKTTLKSRLF